MSMLGIQVTKLAIGIVSTKFCCDSILDIVNDCEMTEN